MFVEATVVFVIMQMSLGLILNVIVGFSVVDGRWRGREAILDLDFTISHRCKCQFCQKRFSLRVLALRMVCKQMTIVAMRPCCKTGAKVVLRRSTTLNSSEPKWRNATNVTVCVGAWSQSVKIGLANEGVRNTYL